MYKVENQKIGTRAINIRLRRDLLDYMEMQGANRSKVLNEVLTEAVRLHQRRGTWTNKTQSSRMQ